MVFADYARYYDLLYKDKDYVGEANYVETLIKKYNPDAFSVLDLGCGTGRHAELLAKSGYDVHGIDMSSEMLAEAYKRAEKQTRLSFTCSNIQDFSLDKEYDVVTALFHVMSYQTYDNALANVFKTVYKHLKSSGVFIFDCWYGPAVLMEQPEVRIKRLENEHLKITRIAEPNMKENENIVEVNYDVFIENRNDGIIKEIKEKHAMRYLFRQELINFAKASGFSYVDSFEFLSNKPLDRTTWGSCFVMKK